MSLLWSWILEVAPTDAKDGPHHIYVWCDILLRIALSFIWQIVPCDTLLRAATIYRQRVLGFYWDSWLPPRIVAPLTSWDFELGARIPVMTSSLRWLSLHLLLSCSNHWQFNQESKGAYDEYGNCTKGTRCSKGATQIDIRASDWAHC